MQLSLSRAAFLSLALVLFAGPALAQGYNPPTLTSLGAMRTDAANATAAALGNIATLATGCNDVTKVVLGNGTCGTVSSYSAPTIGSTLISSGATVPGLAGLDAIQFATNVTPPTGTGFYSNGSGNILFRAANVNTGYISGNNLTMLGSSAQIYIATNTIPILAFGASSDAIISRAAAANIMLGSSNAGLAAIAQTFSINDAIVDGATSNSAGVQWTFRGSRSTGSGVGGDVVFQTTTTGGSALVQNAAATALTLKGGTQAAVFAGNVIQPGYAMLGSGTALTLATGEMGFAKITASGSAPGAAGAKMEWVCGTAAGSMKLISYAGTSTTPVTIVDNVGSGGTGC